MKSLSSSSNKRWKQFSCLFLLSALALLSCAPGTQFSKATAAQAEEPKAAQAPALTRAEGTISAVEKDGTIALLISKGKGMVLYARPESKIYRNKLPAKITDLKVGDRAISLYGGASTIVEIWAEGL